MKQSTLALCGISLAMAFGTSAFADSFNCDSDPATHLHVRIQDDVHTSTRTAAVVIITDTEAAYGARTLISSTNVTQAGPDWTIESSSFTTDTSAPVGELAYADIAKAQVTIPTFDFNAANKDGSLYTGTLALYDGSSEDFAKQEISLACVYNTKN